ncbi:MAG: amidase, partial [Planctomycetota bacterium]
LSNWLRKGKISSVQLTKIYLERLKKYGPKLECVITLTESLALQQAAAADREIAAGKWRGPLHGIPYGLKDLFDTKGIATTWGAESYQNRVPDSDATIVQKLQNAGAVLVAKLTLGALAYGDIWFGGQTKNPWNLKQGSSGSSAGSASAVAAGLVGFAIGTETWGSISSPSARCGIVGFRPTFGRVSRHGAMALCWSLDKVGPLTRTVDDAALVFAAIAGVDTNDAAAIDAPVFLNFNNSIEKIKIGFVESEYSGPRQTPYDRNLLEKLRELKADVAPISIPKEPYAEIINMLISVEGAAAFDEMTRANQDDLLKWQADNAWPNTFRMTRLVPAVEYMQARRVRRKFMKIADDLFKNVDAIIAPASHGDLHALTNMTGQPALTLRIGRRDTGVPICATLWAPLFRDEQLLRIGRVIEEKVGLRALHPKVDW